MWDEREEAHLGVGDFLGRGKKAFDQAAGHTQPGFGFGLPHGANDGVEAHQGLTSPVFANLTEEAVFDGIPLGGTGGVMTDGDLDSKRVNELFLKFPLPGPDPGTVAAAAVGQDQEGVGLGVVLATMVTPPLGDIVGRESRSVMGGADESRAVIAGQIANAVGDGDAVGVGAEVMIRHRCRLQAPNAAWILKIADQFLLLGVDADDGEGSPGKSPSLLFDALKLPVTFRMRFGKPTLS